MMLVAVLTIAVIVIAVVIWDRSTRDRAFRGAPGIGPVIEKQTAGVQPTRFKGKGVVRQPSRIARQSVAKVRPHRSGHIGSRPNSSSRFDGAVRHQPNAIGLACGRPVSECRRGHDCLCVD